VKYIISYKDLNEKVDLDKVERYADFQMDPTDVEFSRHFFDRLTRIEHNDDEITDDDLMGFFKRLAKHKKKFQDFIDRYDQFIVKDRETQINIPFQKRIDQIIAKTIMRKKDFKTRDKAYVM